MAEISHFDQPSAIFIWRAGRRSWQLKMSKAGYLSKCFTTAQVAFSGAHFRFTTAQIVINYAH